MFPEYGIRNGGDPAAEIFLTIAARSLNAYSSGRPPASEAVGVHVDASSKILREVELGTVP